MWVSCYINNLDIWRRIKTKKLEASYNFGTHPLISFVLVQGPQVVNVVQLKAK